MSYAQKIGIYQGDCKVLLGRHKMFSNYIEEFAKSIKEGEYGLDLGTGPSGCNSKFFRHTILDGCDIEKEVVESLSCKETSNDFSKQIYNNTFVYTLGKDNLPYCDNSLDFIICSCVIQHLNNLEELTKGIEEIYRVLKIGGNFYLMFKVGTNNTNLTHHNEYYDEQRTFRVFSVDSVIELCSSFSKYSFEYLLDENHIPYSCCIFEK